MLHYNSRSYLLHCWGDKTKPETMNLHLKFCCVMEILMLWIPYLSGLAGEDLQSGVLEKKNNSYCSSYCTCGTFQSVHLHEALKTVDCSLKSMKAFPENLPTDLQVLTLKGNSIPNIPKSSISQLTDLRELDLSRNRIKSIGRAAIFEKLSNLTYLSLSKNVISTIFRDNLIGLKSLRYLTLSDNKIIYFEDGALVDLMNLQSMDLSHNQLGSLYEDWFHGMDQMITLNIGHNRIHNIPASVFQTLVSLEYLYLSGNRISTVDPRAFSGLTNLQALAMDDNLLAKIPTTAFQSLPNLNILSLDQNPIKKIKPLDFSHLTVTKIGLCNMPELSIIDAKAFYNLANISSILINHNERLTYVDPLSFMNVDGLRDLQLHGNNIKGISQEMETVLPDDVEMSLYGNPFTCDCNIRWLRQLMEEDHDSRLHLMKPEHLVCHAPERLEKKLLKDVDINKIPRVCAPTVLNLTQSDTVAGKVGERLLLECRALGFPLPRLHWILPDGSFVNSTLNEIRRRFFLPGTLVYYHLLPKDGGQYTCLAHNNIGDASISLNLNVSGIDIHLFALRVSSTFVTLTWNGTERQAFPSYKINYYAVVDDENGTMTDGALRSSIASPAGKTVIINQLEPQTTYQFCLGYEDKSGYWLKISCCYATTQDVDFMLQGISGTSNVTVATIMSVVLVTMMLGVCLASVLTRKYRHRLYESPDKVADGSNIPLGNMYRPLLSGS